jgi:hypothetical protein
MRGLPGARIMDSDSLRAKLIDTRDRINHLFAALRPEHYSITSCEDPDCNCVGWAVQDPPSCWEPHGLPGSYWPEGVPRTPMINSYRLALRTRGYVECNLDKGLEPGFEKVAIFAHHGIIFAHAARQLPSGEWTSNLGFLHDIEHRHLSDLEGPEPAYGYVVLVMRRAST